MSQEFDTIKVIFGTAHLPKAATWHPEHFDFIQMHSYIFNLSINDKQH